MDGSREIWSLPKFMISSFAMLEGDAISLEVELILANFALLSLDDSTKAGEDINEDDSEEEEAVTSLLLSKKESEKEKWESIVSTSYHDS